MAFSARGRIEMTGDVDLAAVFSGPVSAKDTAATER
jgi:hypothetical protein